MRTRHAAFVVPVLFVAGLAVAIVLAAGAGPQPATAASVARLAGGAAAEAPQPDPQTAPAACENGTAVPNPASNPGLVADCELLLAAKDTLRGTATLDWSASTAIAGWAGITVSGTPERVTELELDDNELTGTIPAALGGLAGLERLDLEDNELTGAIPAELGALAELRFLRLSDNQLTGSLPAELGELAELSTLYADGNGLTGGIPEALFGLTYLDYVDLSGNQLTGSVPPIREDRFDMQGIKLSDNQLSGTLPVGLGELGLSQLELSGNQFTGCIPQGLREATVNDLDDLGLSDCTTTTTYRLTTSAGSGGSISPLPGHYRYLDGESVTVRVTPDPGLRVALWTGNCASAITATSCVLTLDANKTAHVVFKPELRSLDVAKTGEGSVTPEGRTWIEALHEQTVTASWNDATHELSWGGDCAGTSGSACTLTMDANKEVTATFTELPATRCATTTAADCVLAVYRGAPEDYAQVVDVPADALLAQDSDGRYRVERGQQVTVVTAAPLPAGWTRFYLGRTPLTTDPSPLSFEQAIQPVGTTYTFTPTDDEDGAELITFDLTAARPHPVRPTHKPELGDVVVTTEFEVVSCESGYALTDPDADTELVEDCETLLGLRDTLAGDAALNWSAGTAITNWTGVTVGGTPQRVTALSLADSGLTGVLSGLLGNLTGLEELRLNGNALTGMIPSKLSQLANLTHVYLGGNAFTGCAPSELRAVANNDIAASGLPTCGTPTEIGTGEHTLTSGTYTFTARIPDLPQVTFDVPAGVQLEVSHLSIGIPTAEDPQSVIGLHLQDATGTSRLCIEIQEAFECGRLVADSAGMAAGTAGGAPSLGTAFDRIIESVWADTAAPATELKPYVARNIIVGESIVICSPSPSPGPPPSMLAARVVYPNATEEAVTLWHKALRTGSESGRDYIGRAATVFTTATDCPAATDSDRIDYVQLYGEVPPAEPAEWICGTDPKGNPPGGCFIATAANYSGAPHYTYQNGLLVVINATIFEEAHDGYGSSTNTDSEQKAFSAVRHIIAHELGHALGLGHVLDPDGAEDETCAYLMSCVNTGAPIEAPTDKDYELYKAIYKPNLVQPQRPLAAPYLSTVPGEPDKLRFRFSARNTIAEKRIDIRQQMQTSGSTAWGPVLLHSSDGGAANAMWDLTLAPAPSRGQRLTYGIFVTTDAYLEGQTTVVETIGPNSFTTPIGFPLRVGILIGAEPPVVLPPPPTDRSLLDPPVITAFTISESEVEGTGTYTWSGNAPRFIDWVLSRSSDRDGDYEPVTPPIVDSAGTVRFRPLEPNWWYKLSGQVCQYSAYDPAQPSIRRQFLDCGAWSPDSTPVFLRPLPPPIVIVPPRPTWSLTRSVSPDGSGRISASPRSPFYQGDATVVTLTAIPAFSFYYLTGWGGDCAGAGRGSCTLTMNGNKSVTATFSYDCEPITGCSRSINAEEQRAGFTFKVNSGEDTASGARARTATPLAVTVTIGGSDPLDVSPVQGEAGTWLVQVPANASFLTEGTHDVVVEWRRGEELVSSSTTAIIVDLTAPSVSYAAPTSLSVGTAVSISPSTTDTDIASYALKTGSSLPSGLALDGTSGVVSGTPSAMAAALSVTIVVTDDAGNTRDVTLALPEVDE